jgi:HSA domain
VQHTRSTSADNSRYDVCWLVDWLIGVFFACASVYVCVREDTLPLSLLTTSTIAKLPIHILQLSDRPRELTLKKMEMNRDEELARKQAQHQEFLSGMLAQVKVFREFHAARTKLARKLGKSVISHHNNRERREQQQQEAEKRRGLALLKVGCACV